MTIKHIAIISLAMVSLTAAGCAAKESKPEKPVAPTPASEPVLTSTVKPEQPEPVIVAPPKPVAVAEPMAPEAPFEPTVESVDGVSIQRLLTTSRIEKREPVDPTSTFGAHHEKVFAFLEVSNESDSDKRLSVHFIGPKGEVSGGIELEIPASVPRWRTWAYTSYFDAPGSWRVEIRDAEGSLLGSLPFEVEADR